MAAGFFKLSPGGSYLVAGDEEPAPLGFFIAGGDGKSQETAYKLGLYFEYPLWVGDTQVTSANMDDVLGDGTVRFTLATEGDSPTPATLTLDGANIDGDADGSTGVNEDLFGTITTTLDSLIVNVASDRSRRQRLDER